MLAHAMTFRIAGGRSALSFPEVRISYSIWSSVGMRGWLFQP